MQCSSCKCECWTFEGTGKQKDEHAAHREATAEPDV